MDDCGEGSRRPARGLKRRGRRVDSEISALLSDLNTAIIRIRGAYLAWTKARGMNYHEMLIFYSLRDGKVCSQKQICNHYVLPKQTVNNIVNSLKKRGFLRLETDARNRKEKLLRLTPSGQTYVEEYRKILFEFEKTAVNRVGASELRAMTRTASRYGEILDAVLNPPVVSAMENRDAKKTEKGLEPFPESRL